MHIQDLREVHNIDQGSWRRPRDDGNHILKDLRWQHGDVVHAPSSLRIVHSDGVEQRKLTIHMGMV
jgi:hypothetical protein